MRLRPAAFVVSLLALAAIGAVPSATAGTPRRHAAAGTPRRHAAAGNLRTRVTRSRVVPPAMAHVALTTRSLTSALMTAPVGPFMSKPQPGLPVLHVDDRVRYQRISGFGAAMTDSSAWLIYTQLSPPARAALMGQLFGAAGIRLNFVRVPMGASDFSASGVPYSYDDLPAGETDPQLLRFSIAHDEDYVIPALQLMLQNNPGVQILANPWSPPPWMKANGAYDNLYGRGTLAVEAYAPLAGYFVKFLQAYAGHGIAVAAVTPQNEPGAGSPYPGLNLPADAEGQFVAQYLKPALDAAGLHPQIYGLDRGSMIADARTLLSGPAAGELAGIAWHCYGGQGVMSDLHRDYPSVTQIVSECSPGILPYATTEVAISSTRNWASAVALWNLALDPSGGPVQPKNYGCSGCRGLATISELTRTATLGLDYYQLGHFSKYVQPGAVRIRSDRWVTDFRSPSGHYGVTSGLDNVAFLNPDGSKVLVAYNNSGRRITFAIAWHRRYIAYPLPPRATATFTWR